MFRLEPHQLLFVYAGLGVAFIFLAALFNTLRRTRREREAMRDLMKCGMCAFQFRNASGMVHPRCPNCGSLVEARPLSHL